MHPKRVASHKVAGFIVNHGVAKRFGTLLSCNTCLVVHDHIM